MNDRIHFVCSCGFECSAGLVAESTRDPNGRTVQRNRPTAINETSRLIQEICSHVAAGHVGMVSGLEKCQPLFSPVLKTVAEIPVNGNKIEIRILENE